MADADTPRPPPPLRLLGEARAVLELPRLVMSAPWLAAVPRGHGEHVVVLPGYGASDVSTRVLREFLRRIGYRPHAWGLGRNTGHVAALLPRVLALVESVAGHAGPVFLVGWSLGGYLAREAARERPALVRHVVTLGSPVVGGPKYTAVARLHRERGFDLDAIEAVVDARYARPLTTPVTAVYSKADGIVDWRACIDRRSPNVRHVEVSAPHLGLGFSPEVFRIVAEALAGASGERAPEARP
ncbi:MAG: alpha/beta hydrolase [Burkholderiales bacterium]|nr:alpha/beta hydrolase [Burkholderiales bacterium]